MDILHYTILNDYLNDDSEDTIKRSISNKDIEYDYEPRVQVSYTKTNMCNNTTSVSKRLKNKRPLFIDWSF